jgi:hypothetical protein
VLVRVVGAVRLVVRGEQRPAYVRGDG